MTNKYTVIGAGHGGKAMAAVLDVSNLDAVEEFFGSRPAFPSAAMKPRRRV